MKPLSMETIMRFKVYATGKAWLLLATIFVIAGVVVLVVSNRMKVSGGEGQTSHRVVLGLSSAKAIQRRTTYDGVSFSYSSSLAEEIKAETVKGQLLANANEKPDNATPRHVA